MDNPAPPRWLEWAREIQAIAQSGTHYAENDYQRQRFQRLSQIAAEIVSEYSTLSYPMLAEVFFAQVGYATPRVDVRAAVFQDGRLLLVRERQDGGWTMPGGWMDVGEMPAERCRNARPGKKPASTSKPSASSAYTMPTASAPWRCSTPSSWFTCAI